MKEAGQVVMGYKMFCVEAGQVVGKLGKLLWSIRQIRGNYYVRKVHLSCGFVFHDNNEDCIFVGFHLRPLRECSWVPGAEVNTVLGFFL